MRVLARMLLGLGVFLLVAGILAIAWAPGVVKKTPLDVDTTTVYTGQAAKIDPLTGAFDKKHVYAIRRTKADSRALSDDHIILEEQACAGLRHRRCQGVRQRQRPRPDHRQPSTIFAPDRVTAEAVEDKNLPADASHPEGLVNKFPFDVEKKTYPF